MTAPTGYGIRTGLPGLKSVLVLAIVSKPAVDLLWQMDLLGGGRFGLTPQRLLAFSVPLICVLLVMTSRRSLVLREWSLYALGISAGIAALANGMETSAIDQALRWLSFVAVLLVAPTLIEDERDAARLFRWLVLMSLIPTTICYLQLAGIVPFYYAETSNVSVYAEAAVDVFITSGGTIAQGIGRASGGYQHPTGYTFYVVLALPMAFALYQSRHITPRSFLGFVALTLGALFFTYDRTAYVVVATQLLMMVWYARSASLRAAMSVLIIVVSVILGGAIWRIIFIGGGLSHLSGFDNLFRGRGFLWVLYAEAWLHGPLWRQVIGFGSVLIDRYSFAMGVTLDEPHNDFIRVVYSLGLVGFGIYVHVLWRVFRGAISLRTSFEDSRGFTRSSGQAALMSLVALVLLSVTKEPLRYANFAWPFAILAANALGRQSGVLALR